MEKRLVSLGAPAAKVHYNPCGVDCSTFTPSDPAAAPPVFLAVGRLVEKKGPLLTLQAFALVRRVHPEALLRMIGDGPLLGECQTLIRRLGLGEAVTMLGQQPIQS
jgi:glycosyltransferase involved in cell wall biosynthesis